MSNSEIMQLLVQEQNYTPLTKVEQQTISTMLEEIKDCNNDG